MGDGGCHATGTSNFFQFFKASRIVLMKGEGNVTPWFWPHGIEIVHDVYIVFKSCKELKAKALPSIWCFVYR